jgi:hypothetical protein
VAQVGYMGRIFAFHPRFCQIVHGLQVDAKLRAAAETARRAQNRHFHKDDEAPAAKIQKTDEVFGTAGLVARAIVTARALWVKT